jgi:flagellar hook-length control protein FliK
MTTTSLLPKLSISDSIEKNKLGDRHRSTLPASKREKGFTSALVDARRAKSRQNIAAVSGKKVAGHHGGARVIARKDDLQNFKLGPRVRIIAPDAPPPDDKSLMDFARSQGIDENVIKLIMAKSDADSAGQQPNLDENGLPTDPTAQFVPTISSGPGVASEPAATATADNTTSNVLSPVDSKTAALAGGLTPPSWLTGGAQSENKAPVKPFNTAGELFTYNNKTDQAATVALNAKPALLSVNLEQKTGQLPGSNESIPNGGSSSTIAASQNGLAQGAKDTPPALPAPLAPATAGQAPWLEGSVPGRSVGGLPAETGTMLLDPDRLGSGNGTVSMTITGTSPDKVGAEISASVSANLTEPVQDAAAAATAETANSVFGKQSGKELPLKKALSGQALSVTESESPPVTAAKNPRNPDIFHSIQEINQSAASVAPGHAPPNELLHTTSSGAVAMQRVDISTNPGISPETIQDAAFRRSEEYQLLSDRVSAAVGQRISAEVAKGTWQLDLQLHPAHLGRIDIRLGRRAGGHIDAEFNASESSTKDLLAAGLPKLKEILASAGLELNSLNISGDSAARKENGTSSKQGSAQSSALPSPSESTNAPTLPSSRTNYIRADGLDVTI